jgi:DNA primase
MAGLIPRQFIDDLLARTDIVEIVNSKVPLKKAGKNYQACCPFHSEKSPSFTVSHDKQFYHCFGCGAHGNAISFLMEYERLEFVDAIEELADINNVEVPREQKQSPAQQQKQLEAARQKQTDHQLMEQICRFYQQQLKVHPDKAEVIDYLKGRGLSGEIVKQFSIGYAPDSWDGIMKVFATNHKTSQQLVDLGMAIAGEKNRPYDRFRGRIMFPIRDKRGRVIGFGGRVLADGTPKYLNSPETRIYHKGQELYGLFEAKQTNKQLQQLIVVEGYMDVVALAQHGITNAVASLGTSTTYEQLQSMFRTVNEVVCCYDGDRAGRDAAWRAMENALPLINDGTTLKFIFLPDGEDPDTLVRQQGTAAFAQLIQQAKPLSEFLFDQLLSNIDIKSVEGKANLIKTFEPYLAKLPESATKEGIATKLANFFGHSSEQQLEKLLGKSKQKQTTTAVKTNTKVTPVRLAIALLLEHPHLALAVPDLNLTTLAQVEVAGIDLLVKLMQVCQQTPNINSAQLIEHWRDTEQGAQLAKLLCWQHHIDQEAAEQVFVDALEKLLDSFVEKRLEILLQKARLGQMSETEKRELQALLSQQS